MSAYDEAVQALNSTTALLAVGDMPGDLPERVALRRILQNQEIILLALVGFLHSTGPATYVRNFVE